MIDCEEIEGTIASICAEDITQNKGLRLWRNYEQKKMIRKIPFLLMINKSMAN